MTESPILEGRFSLGESSSKSMYAVTVYDAEIRCSHESGSKSVSSPLQFGRSHKVSRLCSTQVSMSDVIGCDCRKGIKSSASNDGNSAYLVVCAYLPAVPSYSTDQDRDEHVLNCRERATLTLEFNSYAEFEQNLAEAMKWKAVITCLAMKIRVDPSLDLALLQIPNRKKLLTLVNPFSGSGHALHIFQEKIVPVFVEAGLHYHVIITEYGGHARKLIQSIDLEEWDGIVIVSGDGLVYEVINGLMERSDWKKAIQTPIGTLPGGSGNALSCAICHDSGESYLKNHELHAAFVIAKHDVVPMDLVAIDTEFGERIYSFLSVGWGMMADVDIESDRYRQLGGSRFTFMAVVKIAGMKSYRGKLSYLPATEESLSLLRSDGFEEDTERSVIKTPLLPPLNTPVPDNWVTLDSKFILVGAVYQSHLAKDNRMAVESRLDDGLIHLFWVKTGISRLGMVKLLISLENGLHIADPTFTASATALAFRLEPDPSGPTGILTVDGESIKYGAVQGQVLPSVARVMSVRRQSKKVTDL